MLRFVNNIFWAWWVAMVAVAAYMEFFNNAPLTNWQTAQLTAYYVLIARMSDYANSEKNTDHR